MITNVADYFADGCGRCDRFATTDCAARIWSQGLRALRKICLDAGLVEVAKWGHPTYTHHDRNIAILGAFQNDFRINFMNASLLRDGGAHLEKQGPQSQTPTGIKFASVDAVTERTPIIIAYLHELKSYAEAGIKPPQNNVERELPDELVDALDSDPELAEAFWALTRGRRNSYVVNLNGAKLSTTRMSRIAKFRDKILAGKGAQEQ